MTIVMTMPCSLTLMRVLPLSRRTKLEAMPFSCRRWMRYSPVKPAAMPSATFETPSSFRRVEMLMPLPPMWISSLEERLVKPMSSVSGCMT